MKTIITKAWSSDRQEYEEGLRHGAAARRAGYVDYDYITLDGSESPYRAGFSAGWLTAKGGWALGLRFEKSSIIL